MGLISEANNWQPVKLVVLMHFLSVFVPQNEGSERQRLMKYSNENILARIMYVILVSILNLLKHSGFSMYHQA